MKNPMVIKSVETANMKVPNCKIVLLPNFDSKYIERIAPKRVSNVKTIGAMALSPGIAFLTIPPP